MHWLTSQLDCYSRVRVFDNWTSGRALRRYVDSLDPVADDEEITAQVSNVLFADAYFAHSIYLVTFARQCGDPGDRESALSLRQRRHRRPTRASATTTRSSSSRSSTAVATGQRKAARQFSAWKRFTAAS